jgi:penicillin-binding protein A
MQFAHEIKRILFLTLIAFIIIGITSTYWTVIGSNSITLRDDNPRIIEDIIRIQRGSIYDREDRLLAQTQVENDASSRQYLHESTYSTLGYYSLRYGEGGVESAFNDALNGTAEIDNLQQYFDREILHVAPIGSDIQLTLDLDIQNTFVSSMAENRGAGIVLNAQTGDILAMASLPTFDPNTLDEDWDRLTEADGNPFFNRTLQGQYQPGGVIHTLWLAKAILSQYDLSQLTANATDTIALGDNTQIGCAIEPNQSNLSLTQAYHFGCPVPFAVYNRTDADIAYTDLVKTFALDKQITLDNFPIPESITPTVSDDIDLNLQSLRNTLGQGNITVTPLHVAGIVSAIANNGNAPKPNIELSIRSPETTDWLSAKQPSPSVPMMTTTTARQVRAIMESNWKTIQADTYGENIVVGANVTFSLAGDETQLWLIGFVRSEQMGHVAFVVILEDTKDVQIIIPIGQKLIQALIDKQIIP